MIAPIRFFQAFVDREVVDLQLRATFGFLWIPVSLLLMLEEKQDHGGYNKLAYELLEEWSCCRSMTVAARSGGAES